MLKHTYITEQFVPDQVTGPEHAIGKSVPSECLTYNLSVYLQLRRHTHSESLPRSTNGAVYVSVVSETDDTSFARTEIELEKFDLVDREISYDSRSPG